eukprot:440181-Prymnesium_polylepis.1
MMMHGVCPWCSRLGGLKRIRSEQFDVRCAWSTWICPPRDRARPAHGHGPAGRGHHSEALRAETRERHSGGPSDRERRERRPKPSPIHSRTAVPGDPGDDVSRDRGSPNYS